MRFSIRDLLWLTAVVALAATLYTERVQMQRAQAKWNELSEKQAQESANAQALLLAKLTGLRNEYLILQHQLVVQIEKERQREVDEAARRQREAVLSRFSRPRLQSQIVVPDGAEVESGAESVP